MHRITSVAFSCGGAAWCWDTTTTSCKWLRLTHRYLSSRPDMNEQEVSLQGKEQTYSAFWQMVYWPCRNPLNTDCKCVCVHVCVCMCIDERKGTDKQVKYDFLTKDLQLVLLKIRMNVRTVCFRHNVGCESQSLCQMLICDVCGSKVCFL